MVLRRATARLVRKLFKGDWLPDDDEVGSLLEATVAEVEAAVDEVEVDAAAAVEAVFEAAEADAEAVARPGWLPSMVTRSTLASLALLAASLYSAE